MKFKYLFILLILLFACTQKKQNFSLKITTKLFGIPVDLGKMIYKYDSERSFNGDGYSIYVYDIPKEYNDILKTKINEITNTYPIKPKYRAHWNEKKWSLTPYIESEQWFVDFSINNVYFGNNNKELKKATNLFKTLISESGNYYSYFYYIHDFGDKKYVGDIDFFLYSINKRKLIIINHNT